MKAPPAVIPEGSITNSKIAPNAITSDKILDGTIQSVDVAPNFRAPEAVIADSVRKAPPAVILDGSITTEKLANNAVNTAKLQDASVTNSKLAPNAITTDKILDGTIQRADVAPNFKASEADIADSVRRVPPFAIPDGSITSQKIRDGEVKSVDIEDGAITQAKLADNSVTNAKILNGAVTTEKIAEASITTSKIADNSITTLKLADLSVSTAKIQDGAITNSKIQEGAITSDKIQNYTIRTEDVAPDFKPPRASNADSVNGITASFEQLPNTLYPLNQFRGITLVSNPEVYRKPSPKQAEALSNPTAYISVFYSSGVGCLLNLIPGLNVYNCLLEKAIEVGGMPIGGKFNGESVGVWAESETGIALSATSKGGTAIQASSNSGLAGSFLGNVLISGDLNVSKIQGKTISLSATSIGQVLKWDGTRWAPGTDETGSGGGGGTVTSITAGVGLTASPSNPITTSGTISLSSQYQDGSAYDSRFVKENQNFGGDVSGTFSNITVTRIQGRPVSSTAPSAGQVLTWTGSQWAPGTVSGGGGITQLSQGNGIILSPNPITSTGTISVNFGGTGSANTVARSDHNHDERYIINQGSQPQSNTNFWISGTGRASSFYATTASSNPAIWGVNTSDGYGVRGNSSNGIGVYGEAPLAGVYGFSNSGFGVSGITTSGLAGVAGSYGGTGNGYGVWGSNGGSNTTGYAGYFYGRTYVNGNFSASSKSFVIDHPLDPDNKYLYHATVESPDMKNIYDGVVILDENGEAVVELPSYFEALNMEFRYQLTCIGSFAPVYIAQEIQNNRFKIAGGKPGMKVSWQVTGIRKDPFANAHRIVPEVEKEPGNKGKYLHPKELGKPENLGINYTIEKLQSQIQIKEEK
jgi:hypothetical protein